jgi:hypothetical protein
MGQIGMHIENWWEVQKERALGSVGGWIILKQILERGGMNWIDLAQDRD